MRTSKGVMNFVAVKIAYRCFYFLVSERTNINIMSDKQFLVFTMCIYDQLCKSAYRYHCKTDKCQRADLKVRTHGLIYLKTTGWLMHIRVVWNGLQCYVSSLAVLSQLFKSLVPPLFLASFLIQYIFVSCSKVESVRFYNVMLFYSFYNVASTHSKFYNLIVRSWPDHIYISLYA